VREVLNEWNIVNADTKKIILLPIGWETHFVPEMGDRPQSIINKQILKDCDLLVGVFWTRIGTPTGEYASGTVEEIEEHITAKKPVMLYFSGAPVLLDSVDQSQYMRLKNFKETSKANGLFETYSDLNEFKSKFYRQLQLKMNQDAYFKIEALNSSEVVHEVIESLSPSIPKLSREAQVLLKEASQDPAGHILKIRTMGGFVVQTNGKNLVADSNPKTEAIWEGAIRDLQNYGLIEDRGHKGEVLGITREGYEVAELLNP
jgi:hypothetical protein